MFSIIIPTYNAAESLERALDSLSIQNFKNFEVLIIDSLSTDNTIEIAKKYTENLFLNIQSEADQGIYDAMNKSIKIARGEWLYFLGSDDRLSSPDVLSTIVMNIKEDSNIIYGNSVWWPENVREEGEWDYYQLMKRSINHQRIFYQRCLFKNLGNFNTHYIIAADYEMNIRFFCNPAVNLQYIDTEVAYYHSGGFTANKIDENFWDDWKVISKNFRPYLSKREIYLSGGWYCWYNLNKKKYKKSLIIFASIFFKTFDISFLKHTVSQLFKAGSKVPSS